MSLIEIILTEQIQSGARVKVLTKLMAENPDMSGEYQSKLQEAFRTNSDTFNRDNLQIVLAKCGALLHDVDDQLEKIEVGKWSISPQRTIFDDIYFVLCNFKSVR